jgi:hypothetical protein
MSGAGSHELLTYLKTYFPDARAMAVRYLNYAFLGRGLRLMGILRMGNWEDYGPGDAIWAMADSVIDGAKAEWSRAAAPELMRVRDYLAFLEFSRDQRVTVTVIAANPSAGKWIGRAGTRCYAGRLAVVSRAAGPDAGLLAADPTNRTTRTWTRWPTAGRAPRAPSWERLRRSTFVACPAWQWRLALTATNRCSAASIPSDLTVCGGDPTPSRTSRRPALTSASCKARSILDPAGRPPTLTSIPATARRSSSRACWRWTE